MENERQEIKFILQTFMDNSGDYRKEEDSETSGMFRFYFNDKEYGEFFLLVHYHYLNMENTEISIRTEKRHGNILKANIQEFEKILTKESLAVVYHNIWQHNKVDEHIFCKPIK